MLHKRVGHLGRAGMQRLAREGLVRGLEGGLSGELDMCEGCELSRPRPHPHRPVDSTFRSTRPLELVHADLAGPIRVQSWGGAKYMFVLVDDFSRKSWVMLLKNKAEAAGRLKEWKAVVENERGLKLVSLRTDNGGEFTSAALRTWLKEKGVSQQFTPPRTPQANGVAERMNRTLQEIARSMMQDTGLGGGSWGEVFLTASYLRNRGPVRGEEQTPEEMYSGKKPSIAHLRAYGCKVYCPITKMERGGKLGLVRYVGVLVGYAEDSPSYRSGTPSRPRRWQMWGELVLMKRWGRHGGRVGWVGKTWLRWRRSFFQMWLEAGMPQTMRWLRVGCPQPLQVKASRQVGVGQLTWASRHMGWAWLKLITRRTILTSLNCWSGTGRLGSIRLRVLEMTTRRMRRKEGMEEETPPL